VYLEVIKRSGTDISCHEVQAKISSSIQMVADKEKSLTALQEYINMMSPYDYEGLQFLFNEMCKLTVDPATSFKKSILTLGVLMDYNRLESPNEEELQKPDKTSVTAWSKVSLFLY
jgi:hypothetical protein